MCRHVCMGLESGGGGGGVLCLIQKPGNDRVSSFFIIVAHEAPATRGEALSVAEALRSPSSSPPGFFFCLHPLFISKLFISRSIPDVFFCSQD